MPDTEAEKLSYILQLLKYNLEKFPTWVDENDEHYYLVGVYLTKSQIKLLLNILENHNM